MSSSLQTALHSDWERMGLAHYEPGQNAFTVSKCVAEVMPCTTPSKTPVSPELLARRARTNATYQRTQAIKKATRVNPGSNIALNKQSDRDRTNMIVGRRNEARSQ